MGFAGTAGPESKGTESAPLPEGLHGYTLGLLLATLFLLFIGAMVKSTGSSLAVPDWPLSFGQFFPELEGGVFYEHIHRVVAATVALLTLGAALWLQKVSRSSRVRALGWLAFVLVIVQALFGGITVLMQLPPLVSVAHGAAAQSFLAVVSLLVVFTSSSWRSPVPLNASVPDTTVRLLVKALNLARLTFWIVCAQILLGILYRHTGKMLHLHIVVGVLVLIMVHFAFFAVRKALRAVDLFATIPASSPESGSGETPPLFTSITKVSRWLLILTGIQVLLGIAAYLLFLSKLGIPPMSFSGAVLRSLHLWTGSLVLVASLWLYLWSAALSEPLAGRISEAKSVLRGEPA